MIKKATLIGALFFSCLIYSQQKQLEIYFDFDISEANSPSASTLNKWIHENPNALVFKIYGYCDSSGSNLYNDSLSLRRALFVKTSLAENNIKIAENLEIKGFGENFEHSALPRKNRRVSIYYSNQEQESRDVVPKNMKNDIKKLKIGEKLRLKNLNFYDQSGVIVPASRPVFDELLKVLKENPKLKIEIQGHICCQIGTDLEDIANVRAKAIYDLLIENGISKERLRYKSFGSSAPIYQIPEKNEFEKDENRRVEIMILENE